MALEIGHVVNFKSDGKAFSGVIFEFQDDGAVAGLRSLSEKLKALGCGEETHEPTENLEMLFPNQPFKIGAKVHFKSDGPDFFGEVFEYQDGGDVAGLKNLSDRLKGLGCGEETHEPCENLQLVEE